MYQAPNKMAWQGRVDGNEPEVLRWHQLIKVVSLQDFLPPAPEKNSFAFLGFVCEEGVKRNKGRVGAKNAPQVLRKFCSNFPVHQIGKFSLTEVGDCVCADENLEKSQEELAGLVEKLLTNNYQPILFGGGHEIAYAHFQGIKRAFPNKKIGIINFDAHFDLREPDPNVGASSGTGFWQMAQEEKDFNYLVLGIQENSNTKKLFDTAHQFGVEYVRGEAFNYEEKETTLAKVSNFIAKVDCIYLTICLDVFAASYAPGVSAPAYIGLVPDKVFRDIFNAVITSPKLRSVDIAELNPTFDVDNRTARLAASLVYEIVKNK